MELNCRHCGKKFVAYLPFNTNSVYCPYCGNSFILGNEESRVGITITLSGARACGKTTMALFLKQIFENAGAIVRLQSNDLVGRQARQVIKHIVGKDIDLDKMYITIKEITPPLSQSDPETAHKNISIFNDND